MTNDDNLHSHITALVSALRERPPRDMILRERTAQIRKPTAADSSAALKRWAEEYRAVAEETLAGVYHRIDLHSYAILKLTRDKAITAPVWKLAHLATTEINDVRELISEVENASNPGDRLMIVMKIIGAGQRGLPRQKQIEDATAELENYYEAA
jgi:hypothetical protein